MWLFIILTVFSASLGSALLSYYINADQIDRYFKQLSLNSAANFASLVDAEFMSKMKDIALSDEYQKIRQEAEENEDETPIIDYLRQKGVYNEYAANRKRLVTYLQNMDDIKYLYLIYWTGDNGTEDMYLMDDYDNALYYSFGYYEEREPEFAGVDTSGIIEPTVSNGDWGWLCSSYVPVRNNKGELVLHVGCDVGMDDVMSQRRMNLVYDIISALFFTLVILALAIILVNRTIVRPLDAITQGMREFNPSPDNGYTQSGVLNLDIKSNDEIGDIYNEIRSMQVRIVEYLADIVSIQKDKEETEEKLKDKEIEIGQVSREAYRDSLTCVGNKAAYEKKIDELNSRMGDPSLEFAIIMVDVNNLKTVNDNYGHTAGDTYLKGCCHMLCTTFKHSPVFRIGGDEFVAIPQGDDYHDRHEKLEALRKAYREAYAQTDADPWFRYTAATGMSDYTKADKEADLVFKRADVAMYAEKMKFKEENK